MADELTKVALNLRRWRIACATHDVENPTHPPAYGIGVTLYDLERLGFDEGETLWAGVTIHSDEGKPGSFRVLCHAEGDEDDVLERAEELTRAVGAEA